MKEPLVNTEIAQGLKEIGFDWETSVYTNLGPPYQMGYGSDSENYAAMPTLSHAAQYFLEVHKLSIEINSKVDKLWMVEIFEPEKYVKNSMPYHQVLHKEKNRSEFEGRPEALEAALEEAIKIVKGRTIEG